MPYEREGPTGTPAAVPNALALALSQPHEELVPPLSTQALYQQRPDGTIDFKGELRRLSAELLFMFLELLKTVVEEPGRYAQPLTSVNVLLSNLVQLCNMLRPYQARGPLASWTLKRATALVLAALLLSAANEPVRLRSRSP
ncbi:Mediator of RNA polymerase II transcription subunit 7a [Tetrabaena socialis]|uniref:Mediator of RNA polymerase II transcription subunit 7 n=1 Tax=Tetrabaena socialis TaxID=47790 RepID=A0A2J7ZZ22_9CHLO|nr:Mediator of RNA polymerase II transcription subunit 7a [Tetrabaena socialis]|eukprot:PNH05519.1 Mediator of RNA polymerase II transcription subunit 7a [Tetrabaena socialis]